MTFKRISSAIARVMAWLYHHLVWVASACVLLVAVLVMGIRYWVLPNADNYRVNIEQAMSQAVGQRVTIGQLSADWPDLRVRLNLGDVTVYDKAGRAALTLKRVDGTVSWRSVAFWHPRFRALDFYQPALDIRRDARGVLSVAGIEMAGDSKEGGFSDWVLSQRDIRIHNATIDWTDEKRGAPTLQLRDVSLQLLNRGERHRFGVKATAPQQVAGVLDVRGDVLGKSLKKPADWRGRLYANVDAIDLAAWRAWVDLPYELNRGTGALRAWATIRGPAPQELTADMHLADVQARLDKDLPELALSAISGRVKWKKTPAGQEFSTVQLGLTTAGKLILDPMDLSFKSTLDAQGALRGGEFKASVMDVSPLLALAEHIPLPPEARKQLVELSPQGRLADATARWEGVWPALTKYSARGRFENLAIQRQARWPGVKGVSGSLDATEKGGTLQLESRAVKLDLPDLFKAPLEFDTMGAQANWTHDKTGVQIKLSKLAFANADLAGTLSGTFHTIAGQPGVADLTGNLSRADARRVMTYMPLPVAPSARDWLDRAFLAGGSNEVNFRLKGDLREFPFDGDKGGTFFVTAKIAGGTLHYGENWPDLENIEGEFAFRGKGMEALARQATIAGVRVSGVRADIADLAQARRLVLTGDAVGATPDFLKFITASPVAGYIDHFTDGMQGEGPGRLQIRMEMPLRDQSGTRISGNYQMNANRLTLDASIPPLEQVNGRLEFTEGGVNVPAATAVFSGGPLSIAGSTQRDGSIRMALQGRADADVLRRAGGAAWLSQLQGAVDWNGTVTVRKKNVDLVIESTLQGLASTLPVPFAKAAAETLPMRFERRFISGTRDQLAMNVGDVLSARLQRRTDGKRTIIERGTVRLGGGTAAEPERDGVVVSGNLKSVNLDAWLKLAGSGVTSSAGAGAGDVVYALNGLDLKLGEFVVHDRKFGELTISGTAASAETTRYRLMGREIEGIADWSPQGRGRLVAQLQKLTIPAATPAAATEVSRDKRVQEEAAQLPALDVVADHFQMGTKPLGRLELKAVQQQRDWRIEKLTLTHADGTLKADGVWRSWLSNPRTEMNVQWTVADAGSTLSRLGFPGSVRDGIAEISGTLAWDGGPYQLDYASLSGKFAFRAAKGQFRQMEPGIGKLLGIISLQSLPRRLSLDFRDVFSKGFAFDEILGEIKVDHGVASTDKFLITGPAAKVLMGGSVDLSRETQNLQLKVSPHVSEGVAIATGFLGGPIGALAAFVALKLARDPFDNLISFHYAVTGNWADPVVTRVDAPAAQAVNND